RGAGPSPSPNSPPAGGPAPPPPSSRPPPPPRSGRPPPFGRVEDVRLTRAEAEVDAFAHARPGPAIDHDAEFELAVDEVEQRLGAHRFDQIDARGQRVLLRLGDPLEAAGAGARGPAALRRPPAAGGGDGEPG